MKRFLSIALCASVALPLQAGTASWSARSGTLPDELLPYELVSTAAPEVPGWSDDAMRIETSGYTENMYYLMQGDDIALEPVTEIRFGLKLGPGSSNHDARGHAGVMFTLDASIGNAVWFNQGQMFLTSASLTRGPTAAVDTDDQAHDYLIRINGQTAGNPVEVYQDGVLKLTGALIHAASANGPVVRVGFGEISVAGRGTSDWTHFEHNAFAETCPSPCSGEILSDRRPVFSWCPATGATWYELVIHRQGEPYLSQWVEQTTRWRPDANLASGSYCWWVRPWGPVTGTGSWSTSCCFSVDTCFTSAIQGLSPDQTCLPGNPVTLSWDADACATWYEVWISGDGGPWFDQWFAADREGGTVARTLTTAAPFGAHRWWVRGWGPDGMGDWSEPAGFEVGKPDPVGPAGGSSSPVTFTWDDACSAQAAWYQIWVSIDGKDSWHQWMRREETTDCGRGTRCFGPVALPPGSGQWWMRAWSPRGMSAWSEATSVSITSAGE